MLKKNKTLLLILGIIFLAVFFRFFELSKVPPGLYPDVAVNGMDAIHAMENGSYSLFYSANNGREGLYINLIAFSFKVFGVGLWQLRLVGAIVGVLTILGLYFLTKDLFSEKIALFSSFFMATAFWHVNFSRIGFRAILVPFILIWGFFFLFRAIKEGKWWQWIVSGLIFGLGFHTYIAYKIAPLIFLFVLAFNWFFNKDFLKKNWLKIGVFLFSFSLVILPMLHYQKTHPEEFARSGQVSVLNPEVNKGNPVGTLAKTTLLGFSMFNFYGDPNWRHNYSGLPMLNIIVGLLFLGGIVYLIRKLIICFKKRTKKGKKADKEKIVVYLFLFSWLFVMLLPAILTEEGMPHSLRAIGTLPVCFIFAGYFFDFLTEKIKDKVAKKAIIILVLSFILLMDFYLYFFMWAKNPNVHSEFNENMVNIGLYFNNLSDITQKYVIVNKDGTKVEDMPVSAQTVKFITHGKSDVNYILPANIESLDVPANKEVIIALMYFDEEILNKLQQKYPYGFYYNINLDPGTSSDFWLFVVKPSFKNLSYR